MSTKCDVKSLRDKGRCTNWITRQKREKTIKHHHFVLSHIIRRENLGRKQKQRYNMQEKEKKLIIYIYIYIYIYTKPFLKLKILNIDPVTRRAGDSRQEKSDTKAVAKLPELTETPQYSRTFLCFCKIVLGWHPRSRITLIAWILSILKKWKLGKMNMFFYILGWANLFEFVEQKCELFIAGFKHNM